MAIGKEYKENTGAQTITSAPHEIIKIMHLQRRDDALQSIDAYYKMKHAGGDAPEYVVRSRVLTLFFDLEPAMRRTAGEEVGIIFKLINEAGIDDVVKGFRKILAWMDEVHITRIDTRQKINRKIVEEENESKGL